MTQLYRHFDRKGKLLYVGISLSAIIRLGSHMVGSSWADEIDTVRVQNFETRELALSAERIAIQREAPKYNLAGVVSTGSLPSLDLNQRYTIKEAAAYLRISRALLYKRLHSGHIAFLKDGRRTYIHGTEIIRYCDGTAS